MITTFLDELEEPPSYDELVEFVSFLLYREYRKHEYGTYKIHNQATDKLFDKTFLRRPEGERITGGDPYADEDMRLVFAMIDNAPLWCRDMFLPTLFEFHEVLATKKEKNIRLSMEKLQPPTESKEGDANKNPLDDPSDEYLDSFCG